MNIEEDFRELVGELQARVTKLEGTHQRIQKALDARHAAPGEYPEDDHVACANALAEIQEIIKPTGDTNESTRVFSTAVG